MFTVFPSQVKATLSAEILQLNQKLTATDQTSEQLQTEKVCSNMSID